MPESLTLPSLAKVIGKQFRTDPASIGPETTAFDVNGWDSLSHTLLLLEIEKTFGVRIDMRAAFQPANVGELLALIKQSAGGAH
jgi:acyl carrier protein